MFDKKANALAYYYANKDKCKESHKRWVKENFEQRKKYLRGYHKKWHSENRKVLLEKARLYYLSNKPECYKRNIKTMRKRAEFINRKKMSPCVDCKIQYSPWVMEFDHRDPSSKKFAICDGRGAGMDDLIKEMDKCDIVCRNCHAERTHKQRINGVFHVS